MRSLAYAIGATVALATLALAAIDWSPWALLVLLGGPYCLSIGFLAGTNEALGERAGWLHRQALIVGTYIRLLYFVATEPKERTDD